MVVVWRREKAPIALVADKGFIAFLQLAVERGQDRGPGGGVLLHLFAIATDDVAPPGQHDRLGDANRVPSVAHACLGRAGEGPERDRRQGRDGQQENLENASLSS